MLWRAQLPGVDAIVLFAAVTAPATARADPTPELASPLAPIASSAPARPGRDTLSPPLVGTHAEEPSRLRWHDSILYWDHSVTTQTLGVGQSYQSRDPTYEMTLGIRPRFYFVDRETFTWSVRGDIGVVTELTNSDTTTRKNEWSATDALIFNSFTYRLRKSGDELTEFGLRAPVVTLPTSKLSMDNGLGPSLGVRVGLREDLPIAGKGAAWFPNIELAPIAEYAYQFSRSEVPTNPDFERVRLDPEGRSVPSDQLRGATFAQHRLTLGALAWLHVTEAVSFWTFLQVSDGWKYPVRHDVELCGVVDTGCTATTGIADPQTRTVLTSFESRVVVELGELWDVSAGYTNVALQLGPDGRRRSPFYSPEARFSLTLGLRLDNLYQRTDQKAARVAAAPATRAAY